MGRTHALAWQKTPAILAGIVSTDAAGRDTLAQQTHTPIYETLDAMLPHVDVIDVCTPTHTHHALVMQSIAAGKHVVCEKPLARYLNDARAMVDAAQSNGVQLLVGHVVRFFPEYAQARQIVHSGQIGSVGVMRLTRCSFKPARNQPDAWFHDTAKSGGMMLDLMIHDFDYARWVAGEVKTVYARRIGDRFPDAPGDYALAILTHENGAISHIEGGWAYPAPMFRTALEIAGSQGLIEHPAGSSTPIGVHLHQAAANDVDIAVPSSPLAQDPYAVQISHFYDLLSGTASDARITAEDGYEALKIALAALESAKTGRVIALNR